MDDNKRSKVVQMLTEVTGENAVKSKDCVHGTNRKPLASKRKGGAEVTHVRLEHAEDLADVLGALLKIDRRAD